MTQNHDGVTCSTRPKRSWGLRLPCNSSGVAATPQSGCSDSTTVCHRSVSIDVNPGFRDLMSLRVGIVLASLNRCVKQAYESPFSPIGAHMRFPLAAAAALLCLAAACSDDRPLKTALVTAPPRPSLTMSTLPSDASTVCVASVRQRDQLLAKPQSSGSTNLAALDAVIDDVCQ